MVAAPGGDRVAAWEGARVRVIELAGYAARELTLDTDDADLVFAGDCLLVAARKGAATWLRRIGLADLAGRDDERIDGAARLAAGHGATAILLANSGATLIPSPPAPRTTLPDAVGPVRAIVPVDRGAYVVATAERTLSWDPGRPVLASRLAIPLTARACGPCGQLRSLWVLTDAGDLEIHRVSDGRIQRIALPGPAGDVWSHPLSSWLIARVRDRLYRVSLATLQVDAFDAAPVAAQALVVAGLEAALLQDTPDGIQRVYVAGARPDRPLDRRAPPSVLAAPVDGEDARWREVSGLLIATSRPARLPTPVAPVAPIAPVAEAPAPPDWRHQLVAWSAHALAGGLTRHPAGELDGLAAAQKLGSVATRQLAILYGRWLAGEGHGIPAANLARAAPGDDSWREALGAGALVERGLARFRRGWLHLTAATADHLDGRPRRAIALDWEPRPPSSRGLSRVVTEAPSTAAAELAREIGAALHVSGTLARARQEAGLIGVTLVSATDSVEIRVHGWESIILVTGTGKPV
jgi:hypothetical protein